MDTQIYDKIIALTKQLIAIASVTGERAYIDNALTTVIKPIKHFPMETFVSDGVKSLLIRNIEKETRDFTLLLNAHLDVVPGKPEQFKPYEKNGKLYGRGAYDMKTALAIMIYLFSDVARELPFPAALQITTDEEAGGENGTKYQLEQGIRTQFAITGDAGSNVQLVNKTKGMYWFKLHAKGVAAHSGYPWRGKNALWKIHHAVALLHKAFPTPTRDTWRTTMNLAKIETENNVFNNVPDQATASIDMRFIPEDEKVIEERVRSIIPADITIESFMKEAAEYTAEDNPFLQKLSYAIQHVTKKKAQFVSAHGSSDIRHFNVLGYSGVEFGLTGAGQHEENEYIEIKSIEKYYYILKVFLLNISEQKERKIFPPLLNLS